MCDCNAETPLLAAHIERETAFQRLFSSWTFISIFIRRLCRLVCTYILQLSNAVWQDLAREPAKTIHAFKMALAFTLTFLLALIKAPYTLFGEHIIWAIMTVIVIFEFTIGATLSKGFNRGIGTLLAGLLAVIIGELAGLGKGIIHPIMVGVSVFIIGAVVTYGKLRPTMKLYEYGFRTFLITFGYIMLVAYRKSDPIGTAVNRFFIILLGAIIGVCVNVCVLPLWAGDELHELVSKNFDSLADSLEVCVSEYLRGVVLERVPSKILMGLAADDPVYKGYRSALLSATKEDSLATFASWELPHGRFRRFRYPWKNYVKVGAILRHCTYSIVALHSCLRSAIQAPVQVRTIFKDELLELSQECALVFRKLGHQVWRMQKGDGVDILKGVHRAIERLQQSLYLHSYLLIRPETDVLKRKLMEELPLNVIPETKKIETLLEGDEVVAGFNSTKLGKASSQEPQEESTRRGYKRLHSWPHRSIGDHKLTDPVFQQKVRVLESASALSLGTFATLLVEAALRLDHLVEAVEELGELGKFQEVEKVHWNNGIGLQ